MANSISTLITKDPLTFALGASVFCTLSVILYLYIQFKRKFRTDLPSSPPHPLFGHALQVLYRFRDILHWFHEETVKRGPSRALYIPFQPPYVLINDAGNFEYMLKTNFDNFVKGEVLHEILEPFLGEGVFNVDGDKWKVQRKVAAHIFNVKNFRDFFMKVFEEHIGTLCDILRDASETDTVVNIYDLFHRLTMDSFCEIGFGHKLGSLHTKGQLPFTEAFDNIQQIVDSRLLAPRPVWYWGEYITGKKFKLRTYQKVIFGFCQKMITDRKSDPNFENYEDLLSRFMAVKDDEGNGYSDPELRDILLNLIIAGRDTTAINLSWAIYELCQHPEVVRKMREEIATMSPNSIPDYDTFKNMKYCQSVFLEAQRLYPSIPKNFKYAVKDDVFPDGTKVYAGNAVMWSNWVMGRSTDIWGDDALEFKPERWEKGHPGQFKYPHFHAGPRICLGMNMAIQEGTCCLVQVIRQFDIELTKDPKEVTYQNAIALQMKGGLPVRIKRSKNAV
ncbi:cytochrome P450 [Paraphysoderma sedebokerense]|nr:cytochrome P450 [Paraphysoderma sedebokerense]